jgi:membrane protein implicated in regulation of membrane protease activity
MAHARRMKFAIVIAITSILLVAAVLTSSSYAFETRAIGRLAKLAVTAISEGYRAAPALMLGLALAVGLPLLTAVARVVRPLTRSADATRRYQPEHDVDGEAAVAIDVDGAGHVPFVEIESGGKGVRCALQRDMLRIGREDDNDIRMRNGSVHRYHAAIHREDYDDWHITDLSGVEGNGLIVNGRRCCEARLNDGDVIELGAGRLRFRAGVV